LRLPNETRNRILQKVEKARSLVEYFTLDGMITKEMGGGGGAPSPAAVQGAMKRCLKALERGGKWYRIDKDSERLEFRRITKLEYTDYSTIHEQRKEETKKSSDDTATKEEKPETSTGNNDADDDITPEKGAAAGSTSSRVAERAQVAGQPKPTETAGGASRHSAAAAPKGKAKAKAKGKAKSKGKAAAKKAPDQNAVKRKASQMEAAYHKIMNRASKRVRAIETEDAWAWARDDKFKGRLDKYMQKVASELTSFPALKEMLDEGNPLDEETVRDVHGTMAKLQKFEKTLNNLDGQIDTLTETHHADATSNSQ
jgi:hypothetical protein